MASISRLCPDERVRQRRDLVMRPILELGMCMVYRPRPARIISLNASGWLLLRLCDGSRVGDIEASYLELLHGSDRQTGSRDAQMGLRALAEHDLILAEPDGTDPARTSGGDDG
ncbi:MAG: hypothetical protein KJZ80_13835 [Hyphomicrobiaceae bacterium]|nr:hypothetical protein [Hyphomicrobiaceae bacterium]